MFVVVFKGKEWRIGMDKRIPSKIIHVSHMLKI